MNHSLHRADLKTHVRIVVIALAAGITVVIGALNMKIGRAAGPEVWAHQASSRRHRRPCIRLA